MKPSRKPTAPRPQKYPTKIIQIAPYLQTTAANSYDSCGTEKLNAKQPIDPKVSTLIRKLYQGWPPTERAILARKTIVFPG